MSVINQDERNDNPTGSAVLDDVEALLRRFLVLPNPHAFVAVVLWIAHTHASLAFYTTPRLIVQSAELGSGKTRVLELLRLLVQAPMLTISTTVAALFRRIGTAEGNPPTLLQDEFDAIFNPRSAPQYEDYRALLNSGYKKGATVDRCVGDGAKMTVQEFKVFAPVAMAGIGGHLPDTIVSRSIVLQIRRRAPSEVVEPYRERSVQPDADMLKERLAGWVKLVEEHLAVAEPVMPDGVVDRPSEVWEPLLAVADAAGGQWPRRAREACKWFVLSREPDAASLGSRLLGDIRLVFHRNDDAEHLSTAMLLDQLNALEESPWRDYRGKPFDSRHLSAQLGRYEVKPQNKRVGQKVHKGYYVADFADAWSRYLQPFVCDDDECPRCHPDNSATSATSVTRQVSAVAGANGVAGTSATGLDGATPVTCDVAPVADVAGHSRASADGGSSVPDVSESRALHVVPTKAETPRDLAQRLGPRCARCGDPVAHRYGAQGNPLCGACQDVQAAARAVTR
jgi:hypothetical protein